MSITADCVDICKQFGFDCIEWDGEETITAKKWNPDGYLEPFSPQEFKEGSPTKSELLSMGVRCHAWYEPPFVVYVNAERFKFIKENLWRSFVPEG